MGIFNWVKQLFAIKATTRSQATDLQALFGGEATASLTLPSHQDYPLVTPTTETELSAYQLHCLLNEQDKQRLDTLLCQAGFEHVDSDAPFNGVLHHTHLQTTVFLQQYADFAGFCVLLITNDINLLQQLITFKAAPPAPWESFPDVDPDTLGSLQGNLEFWCDAFWRPYWLSLGETERLQYPINWREFSEFH
ncbi:hypothetical protein [Shewanella xiamenensis]|uniref:hypothetical protein n=1 Tax=Shewanella xiamenensis TaxID=332186 RepID=UPI0015587C62|nr:hypothetical protein [Shewanella xiamenensis]